MTLRSAFAGRSGNLPCCIALAAAVVFALLSSAGMAAAAEGGDPDYGVRPAPVGDGSRPIDRFQHGLEPGTSIPDAFQIFNFSDEPAVFDVYQADMVPSSNGDLAPAARNVAVVGEGTWLSLEESSVELGPGESATVEFTISVPLEASIGEHRGVILVERQEAPGSGTLELKTRVGLVVGIDVLREVALAGSVGPMTWDRDHGHIAFQVSLTNTGEPSFGASGVVEVTDRAGGPVARVSLTPAGRYVAPGETATFEGVWEDPPLFGRYEATPIIEATVGLREPVILEGTPLGFSLVPWAQIIVVFLALAYVVWGLYRIRPILVRRARRRREERELIRDFRRRRFLEEERRKIGGRHQPGI